MKKKDLRNRDINVMLYRYKDKETGRKMSKAFPAVDNTGKKLIWGLSEDGENLKHLEDRLLGTTYRIEIWLIGGLADYCKVLPCGCKVYRDQVVPRARKIKKPEQRRIGKLYKIHSPALIKSMVR